MSGSFSSHEGMLYCSSLYAVVLILLQVFDSRVVGLKPAQFSLNRLLSNLNHMCWIREVLF